MSFQNPPVTPVVIGLRVGLQVLFVALLGFVVGMGMIVPGEPTIAILVVSVMTLLTYGASVLGALVEDPRRRRALRWTWVALLTIEWVALVSLTPFAAYLVFPLFFLYLDLIPEPFATGAVAVSTGGAIVALGMHDGWTIGGVLGPIVGAGVAVLIGRAYRALRLESAEHQRLYADLLAAQDRLAAVERQAGVLSERERLAREIHDTVAQSLSSITLLLNAVERSDPEAPTIAQVRLAREAAAESLSDARRFIRELAPPLLDERTIGGALRRLAATWRRPGLRVEVEAADALDLPMDVQTALLRVAQGAMANVIEHAQARTARVILGRDGSSVLLTVIDDGVGFVYESSAPAGGGDSFGLRAIRARVEQLGGVLDVQTAPGAGTRLTVDIPVGVR